MIGFVDGVTINGMQPELVPVLLALQDLAQSRNITLWVTSVTNGEHSRASLHYVGYALDVDTNDSHKDFLPDLSVSLEIRLTHEYDVVLERGSDGQPSHVHIEFQPKR